MPKPVGTVVTPPPRTLTGAEGTHGVVPAHEERVPDVDVVKPDVGTIDSTDKPNAFEDAARGAFVAAQDGDKPAPGLNPITARLPGGPSVGPLAKMAALVPVAASLGQAQAQALVALINARLAKGAADGETFLNVGTRALDPLLTAWSPPHSGYDDVAKALTQLGYRTQVDGFMGIDIIVPAPPTATPAVDPDAFSAALKQKLPAPPGGSDPGERLGALVMQKIEAAVAQGKNSIDLDTAELDRILGRGARYDDVASVLKDLGYNSFADGFMGVSASWDKSTDAPAPKDVLDAIAAGVQRPQGAGSPVDALVALVEQKIEAAQAGGEKSFDLSPSELDRLVDKTFGGAGGGYAAVADALKQRGYRAFADGFIGVSAGWT